jgi:hypothetical protein
MVGDCKNLWIMLMVCLWPTISQIVITCKTKLTMPATIRPLPVNFKFTIFRIMWIYVQGMNDYDWILQDIQFLLLFLFDENEQVKYLNLSQWLVTTRIQGKQVVTCKIVKEIKIMWAVYRIHISCTNSNSRRTQISLHFIRTSWSTLRLSNSRSVQSYIFNVVFLESLSESPVKLGPCDTSFDVLNSLLLRAPDWWEFRTPTFRERYDKFVV